MTPTVYVYNKAIDSILVSTKPYSLLVHIWGEIMGTIRIGRRQKAYAALRRLLNNVTKRNNALEALMLGLAHIEKVYA